MRKTLLLPCLLLPMLVGCAKKPEIDYSALDQSGMWSANLDQLKKMKVTPQEITQLSKLKQAGASDDFCLALFKTARDHQHDFTSGDSAVNLSRAGYTDAEILEMAQSDKIDILSGDAVMLKLIGVSNSMVHTVIQRREQGLPTLTSEQIGRLKNTGMSENNILQLVNAGLSSEDAEAKIKKLEAARNHAHTDFVHTRGRRSH